MIGAVTAPIIFGQMYFLLISENEIFHELKRDGITSLHGIHAFRQPLFFSFSVLDNCDVVMTQKEGEGQMLGILRNTELECGNSFTDSIYDVMRSKIPLEVLGLLLAGVVTGANVELCSFFGQHGTLRVGNNSSFTKGCVPNHKERS